MKYTFAKRFDGLEPSGIRAVMVKAAGPDMINLSPGFPDNSAFPIAEIQDISKRLLEERPYEILQYARAATYPPLKDAVIDFFNKDDTIVFESDDVMITSGSGEGLELASKVFLNPGDSIIVEDPTFVGALNGFLSNEAKLIGVPLEKDGLNLELLEKAMQVKPTPKLLYIIPTFQNPSCITTSLEKRKAIYDLCVKYGIMILEDNPYGALRFKGEKVPTLKSMDTEGIVIYCASLSKIISPGMRIGTIVANSEIVEKFTTLKGTSGGAATNWSQQVIAEFLTTTDMNKHLEHLRQVYGKKSTFMIETMKKTFHPDVKFEAPDGGMFVWFELPEYVDASAYLDKALTMHIAIVPQSAFAVNKDRVQNGVRLSFTGASLEEIEKGITKLGELTYEFCK